LGWGFGLGFVFGFDPGDGGVVEGAGGAGDHAEVPTGEDVGVFVTGAVEEGGPVGEVVSGEVFGVDSFAADDAVGMHFEGGHEVGAAVDEVVGAPEEACAEEIVGGVVRIAGDKGEVVGGAGGVDERHGLHDGGDGGGFGVRGVGEELAATGADVHGAAPGDPVLALEEVVAEDGEFGSGESEGGVAENDGPAGDVGGVGEAVVAELELGAVLVEAPVGLDAFVGGGDGDFFVDDGGGFFDEGGVVLEDALHEGVAGDPDAVLAGHGSDFGAGHGDGGDVGEFGGGEVAVEEECDGAEDFGIADVVIPPVGAFEIVPGPEGEGAVDGGD